MDIDTAPRTCETDDCTEAREFRATSPSGAFVLGLCGEHAEPAERMSWTVTDLDGQPV